MWAYTCFTFYPRTRWATWETRMLECSCLGCDEDGAEADYHQPAIPCSYISGNIYTAVHLHNSTSCLCFTHAPTSPSPLCGSRLDLPMVATRNFNLHHSCMWPGSMAKWGTYVILITAQSCNSSLHRLVFTIHHCCFILMKLYNTNSLYDTWTLEVGVVKLTSVYHTRT